MNEPVEPLEVEPPDVPGLPHYTCRNTLQDL
jgi:hypothetical protein